MNYVATHYEELLHYKGERGSPWIRFYVDLLKEDWVRYELSDDAKAALPWLWLLACQLTNEIPSDPVVLARRLPFTAWDVDTVQRVMEELCEKKVFRLAAEGEIPEPTEAKPEPTGVKLGGELPGAVMVVELDSVGPQPKVPVFSDFIDSVRDLYPALDLVYETRRAGQWLLNNPAKRKTARGMRKFLSGWFDRAQNRPRPVGFHGQLGDL